MTVLEVLGFIIPISLLIIVHEAGHYLVARWCTMDVERFSLGFGPAVFSRRYNGTQFQIAPIFFGGFVEIKGMNIAEEVDARDARAYPNRPAWQRFLTIFAGPATNYLFAMVLALVLFVLAGLPSGTIWYQVASVEPGTTAAGKLEPGDRIIALQRARDPEPVALYFLHEGKRQQSSLSEIVHGSKGEPIGVTVLRDGEELTYELQATPHPEVVWKDTGEKQYRLGIMRTLDQERVQVGFLRATAEALYYPFYETKRILSFLGEAVQCRQEVEVIGPVGIASDFKKAMDAGWVHWLRLFMGMSVWLGLFNLFPLPALDGGRLVFLIYEMATRRRANPKVEATVHMVGIMVFLVLMMVVTFKDCSRVATDIWG